ncbi:amidinotransferase [Parafrankia sp. FMc6]|uniref:amidinotransferase n=1 Tax=Parafrankia soli TaxID=2599596 RepID=UPI0034D77E8C
MPPGGQEPTSRAPASWRTDAPVSCYTEWDPLEEVIVGIVDGAVFPPWHLSVEAPAPPDQRRVLRDNAATPFPPERVAAAARELDTLVAILEAEGVRVRRPEPRDHLRPYGAPGWTSTGLYDAMPRDVLFVIGDEILECPMAWRSRYYATSSFRPLLKEYFRAGARWTSAPRPELPDDLYDQTWTDDEAWTDEETRTDDEPADRAAAGGPSGPRFRSIITEFEPTFDAADFVRCGRDIVAQRSNVTNAFGIEWLRRHLGEEFRVHVVDVEDAHPMHIDATLVPLAPGKLLINPERVPRVPAIFKGWDILPAPRPVIPADHPLYLTSKWLNMNLLSLDTERVIVERDDAPMIAALKSWGFTPIPCPFRNFNSFGGSFHCATVDIRRRGGPVSWF